MKTFFIRAAAALLLSTFALSANATTYVGTWLDSANWTLIHAGSGPADSGIGVNNLLRWNPGQEVVFDLTGTTLTATGPQAFSLSSNKGDTATFTLVSMTLDLSGPNGLAGGSLDYSMLVDDGPLVGSYSGTFTFAEQTYGSSPFNSSDIDGGVLNVFLWGGDVANDIGIDVGISAVVPIPAPLLLLGSALFGLGLTRRRK